MAVELAKAYIQIIPSMKGMKGNITKELAGIEAGMGSLGSRIGKTLSTSIGLAMKSGLVASGAAVGGVIATALTKGFKRLSAFEQAEHALKGMKLSAQEVAVVMDNANAAVKGTAYGLDEAATAAKLMVTAGVKPGKELERVLSLIGDSAAQSGSSMQDMGLIWAQVLAKGKLQGDDALQMMQRGIPIYQMVADELGVTAEEARKLGEQGKISFDVFADAVENQFGGAAKAMGDTVSGASRNVMAALGRLGEAVLKGPYADIPGVLGGVQEQIDKITPKIELSADAAYSALEDFRRVMSGQKSDGGLAKAFGLQAVLVEDSARRMSKVAGEVRTAFAGLGGAISRELSPLTRIDMTKAISAFERVGTVAGQTAAGLANFGAAIVPSLGNLGKVAGILGGGVLSALERVVPAFANLAQAVGVATQPLSAAFIPAAHAVATVMIPVADVISVVANAVAAMPTPVLAAGAAFMMLHRNMRLINPVMSAISSGAGTAKVAIGLIGREFMNASGFSGRFKAAGEAAGVAMMGLQGKIAKVGLTLKTAFVSNAPMLAISALIAVLGSFAQKNQEAKAHVDELADSFDKVGTSATEATREIIAGSLENSGALQAYQELGGSVNDLVAAAMGEEEALKRVNAIINQHKGETEGAITATGDYQLKLSDAAEASSLVEGALRDESDAFSEAEQSARRKNDAIQEAIDLSKGALAAEQDYTNYLVAQQDAQFGLLHAKESVNRANERANQILQDSSASAQEVESAIGGVAEEYYKMAQQAGKAGQSQGEIQAILDEGAGKIRAYGEAHGWTNEQIQHYIDMLTNVPAEKLTTLNADTANAMAEVNGLILKVDQAHGTLEINGNAFPADMTVAEAKQRYANDPAMMRLLADATDADMTLIDYVARVIAQNPNVTLGANNKPASAKLDSTLGKMNSSVGTATLDANNRPATNELAVTKSRMDHTTGVMNVDANGKQARDEVELLKRHVGRNPGTFTINPDGSRVDAWAARKQGQTIASGIFKIVQKIVNAEGGVYESFASGGVRRGESHRAQIASGSATMRVWAEPETGGEAYIPLALSKRHRSTMILAEVARRFGYQLAAYSAGGIAGDERPVYEPVQVPLGVYGAGDSGRMFPRTVVLRVGDREFPAYMEELADGRIAANPGVQAVSDVVANRSRYALQMGV